MRLAASRLFLDVYGFHDSVVLRNDLKTQFSINIFFDRRVLRTRFPQGHTLIAKDALCREFTMKKLVCCSALFACMAVVSPVAAQTIIISDGDASSLQSYNLLTGAQNWSVTSHSLGYPLSVRNSIWLGHRDNTDSAFEYSFATGAPTGNSAVLSGVDQSQLLDGTTDGTFNYSVRFNDSGVYRANADWTDSNFLFSVPVGGGLPVGIAYSSTTNSMWVSTATQIFRYSMTGTEEFFFPHTGGFGALAFDNNNNTLWLVPNDPGLDLLHYDTSGNLIDTLVASGRSSTVWGAEIQFAAVPEPGTVALLAGLAVAGGASAWWRKRKNNRHATSVRVR